MNLTILARLAPILLLLSIACEGGKKSCFQLPPDLGKGLSPADSLRAVLNYLKGRREYQAETLRFDYMYEYIRTLAPQKPDTLPALVQALRSWAQKSQYLLGKGVADRVGQAWAFWVPDFGKGRQFTPSLVGLQELQHSPPPFTRKAQRG